METPQTPPSQPVSPREEALAKAEQDAIRKSIPTYEELLAEAEASMNVDIEKWKKEDPEEQAKRVESEKRHKLESTGTIQQKSAKAAEKAIASRLDSALLMADSPESVEMLLVREAVEEVRGALGTAEDYRKVNEDERLIPMYAAVDNTVRHEVVVALKSRLEPLLAEADDEKKAKLEKIIQAVSKADPLEGKMAA